MINIKKYIKYIGNAITVVSIVFVIITILKLDINLNRINNVKSFFLIGITSTLAIMITVYLLSYAWKLIIEYFSNKKLPYEKVAIIYAKSNLGKYLPGNVMHYLERNYFAHQAGLDNMEVAVSSIIEILGIVIVALIISVVFVHNELIITLSRFIDWKLILLLIIIIFIVLGIGLMFFYKKYYKVREMINLVLNVNFIKLILKLLIIYSLVLLILGVILVSICKFVLICNIDSNQVGLVITYYMVAWVIGFIIPGAPGGMGVREFVLVMLLANTIGEENIIFASLIHRIISIIGDVEAYVVAWILEHKKN